MVRKILIVEDRQELREALGDILSSAGHAVIGAESAKMGWHLFQMDKPDLVLLDVGLPDGSGLDLCRKMRSHKALSATPIIVLTGLSALEHKTAGFDAGADQYLVKTVQPKELVLWVEALLRRVRFDLDDGGELQAGELVLDVKGHIVHCGAQVVPDLTRREYDLLYMLVKKRPTVLTRRFILSVVWRTVAVDHLVDVYVSNLRKKLPPTFAGRIQSVPGKGFRYFE